MTTPLLATKLYLPHPPAHFVSRPRLIDRLNAEGDTRLILISAAAGSGKTTLLSEWIAPSLTLSRRAGEGIAWLSLDEGDNDPARFWTYVIAALQTRHPSLGAAARSLLASPQPAPAESILTPLLNDLTALTDPIVLVLDDYHVIESRAIHDGLTFLLDHLPPQLRVILATRSDPPLPLGRLRARGQLLELRAADLRFTPQEAAEFLNRVMGLGLTPDDLAALEARTEGWIAGLQLAALSLQGRSDAPAFIRTFTGSHRFVLEYLVEEVLNRQTPDVQAFLLQSAVLDRLCSSLSDTVLERHDSQAVLQALDKANLFLLPLDDQHEWYRYHHLFAELLRARLQQLSPDVIPVLHRRAADWFDEQGYGVEAVKHTLAGHAYERLGDLLEKYTVLLMTRGEMTTLVKWINALPPEVMQRRPYLLISLGWIYTFAGQIEKVEPLLQQAERQLQESALLAANADARGVGSLGLAQTPDALRGSMMSMRAFIAGIVGQIDRAVEYAQEADRLLPSDDYISRSIVPYTLGRMYRIRGDMLPAIAKFEELLEVGEHAGLWTWSVAIYELALTYKLHGRLRKAEALYQEGWRVLDQQGVRQLGAMAKVDCGYSDLFREWNDLDRARELAQAAVDHMQMWRNPQDVTVGYTNLARVLLTCGDLDGTRRACEAAEQVQRQYQLIPVLISNIEQCRVRLWLAEDRLSEALQWAEDHLQRPTDDTLFTREVEALLMAHVFLKAGQADRVLPLLASFASSAETQERTGRLIENLVLQAVVFAAIDEPDRALAALEKALTLAEPEGYVRVFVDEGAALKLLIADCRVLIAQQPDRARLLNYADRLLEAFSPSEVISSQKSTINNLIKPLSERELDVLRLLAQGLSNTAIADRLVVSVGTVKSHVHHIYGKLGVQSRTQAILRAKELQLL